MSMNLTLELRASARCEACSVLTPMIGIRNKLSCRNCAATIDFAKRVEDSRDGGVRYPLGGYYDAVAEAALVLKDGDDCLDARDSQGTPVALRKVAAPECLSCERPLALPADGVSSVCCDSCGDTVGVRWPDDETRSWDPRIRCIVGDPLHRRRRSQGERPGARGPLAGHGDQLRPVQCATRRRRDRSPAGAPLHALPCGELSRRRCDARVVSAA